MTGPRDLVPEVGTRTLAEVVARAEALFAVARRGALEVRHLGGEDCRDAVANLRQGVDEATLTASEQALLASPLGELEAPAIIQATWRIEAVAVLLWALGTLELTALDGASIVVLPGFARLARGVVAPRGLDDLTRYEALLYDLHWRVRDFAREPRPYALSAMLTPLPRLPGVAPLAFADGDLALGGVPLARAPKSAVARLGQVVTERRWAASWLIHRQRAPWDETPLDT